MFQAATLTTVVAFLLESALLTTPMGARLFAFTWLCLSVIAVACRVAARAIARHLAAPERCLLVGDVGGRGAARVQAGGEPERQGDVRRSDSFGRESRIDGRPGTRHARRSAAGRRRTRCAPRDRRRRRGNAPERARRDPEREGARASGSACCRGCSRSSDRQWRSTTSTASPSLAFAASGSRRASRRVKRAFDVVGSALGARAARAAHGDDRGGGQAQLPGPGPLPPDPRRARRPYLRDAQVPHDGRRRRRAEGRAAVTQRGRRAVQDRRRPSGHARSGGSCAGRRSTSSRSSFNVLRGQMSLVGPRPLVLDEDRRIEGWYRRRLLLDARDDRRLADLRRGAHPAAGDGHDRLPLRLELVAVGGHQDPAAHDPVRGRRAAASDRGAGARAGRSGARRA